MDRESRSQIIAITVAGMLVIILAAFLWPGSGGLAFPSGPTMLFDEALVEEIYHRVSPAVVEIYADTQSGNSFNQTSAGSGFLVDSEGFIALSRDSAANGRIAPAGLRHPSHRTGRATLTAPGSPSDGCS